MADAAAPGPGPGWAVVRLAEDDWPVLREVRLAALADSPDSFGPALRQEQAYGEERWRETLRAGAVFAAVPAGPAAGQSPASPVGLAVGIPRARSGECGLGAMWVAPPWRGHGVAAALVAAVLAWARTEHRPRVGLWAPADNPRACRFYQRQGFAPTGRREPFPGAQGRHITEMYLDLSG